MPTKCEIIHGDSLDVLPRFNENRFGAIVTDPPYGLSFMGKKWDHAVPSVDVWRACLRVIKPGGHLLAFAGTRTQHRMCCNIEDAGFEIRDMIAWIYGIGFPKSLDVSKAIDKAAGAEREVVGKSTRHFSKAQSGIINPQGAGGVPDVTAPATPEAEQWEGWGTALKPALEPITLARKPLSEKTVAANVLRWGTGALNIDACRIGTHAKKWSTPKCGIWNPSENNGAKLEENEKGRFPANLIHDGSPEVLAIFPDTGASKSGGKAGWQKGDYVGGESNSNVKRKGYDEAAGSAARFFYTAKASKAERGHVNFHPTVKPVSLMAYLVRLVTPIGATVLDPFAGSGTTGVAAEMEGFNVVLIEREAEWVETIRTRTQQPGLGLGK